MIKANERGVEVEGSLYQISEELVTILRAVDTGTELNVKDFLNEYIKGTFDGVQGLVKYEKSISYLYGTEEEDDDIY